MTDIIAHCREARLYLDSLSELLRQVEPVVPTAILLAIGDKLASLQTLFQRIEAAARGYRQTRHIKNG